jgi:hypothetical protein
MDKFKTPEYQKAKNKKYYDAHKEKCKEATRKWVEANPERAKEIQREAVKRFREKKKLEKGNSLGEL